MPHEVLLEFQASADVDSPRTGYRLPTADEWHHACQAGSESVYSFGDTDELLGDYAWYLRAETQPVAERKPNLWGFFDMVGNVAEWGGDLRTSSAGFEMAYEIHGGAFSDPPKALRRSPLDIPESNFHIYGFRIARSLAEGE